MPYPPKPADHYDYVAWQSSEPTLPLPAPQVSADFDHLKQSVDVTIDFLKGVFTEVGELRPTALPAGVGTGTGGSTIPQMPFRINAIAADGEVYTSGRVVSNQLYTIRDHGGFLKTDGADTWDIVLDRRPSPVPTTLTIRAAGMNRINNLLPQVDGTWTVTPVSGDPYRFTLVGSTYGSMYADGGVAYVPGTLIDASAELDALAVWLRAHGGGHVTMPPCGGIYLASGSLRLAENTIWDCQNCFTFKADARDQTTPFNNSVGTGAAGAPPNFGNVSKLIVRNLWVYDNRGYQTFGAGQHAINLGTSNSPEKISQWIEFDGVHVRGAAGYGESSANNNGTINFTRRNGSIKWTDGDSRDRKNGLNLNDQINFQNETHDWPALGDLGTNLRAVRGTANPFSVASVGASTVRVAWAKHGFKTGSKVMISGVTQGNGLTIASTAVAITVTSAGQFTIPATGAALNTASWGGSAVQILPCIANNGVTTFSGEKYIEIPRSTDALTRVGEKVTLGTSITLNNVPLGGVWDCIATTSSTLRLAHMDPDTGLATGATANASGSGGGDSITFLCPHISSGDRIIDSRGARTSLRSIRSRGEFYGRAGITARGGTVTNVNGDGAHHISIYDYKIVDLTPAWIAAAGGGTGLALDCDGALVEDVYITGRGLGVGVLFGASSVGSQLSNFEIDGPQTGIQLRGSRHIIGKGKIRNASALGVALWGYIVSNRADLPENAFTPVAIGDPRAIVSSPGHGISSGTNATIIDISQTNPVVITTSAPHGMTTGVRVGIKDVVGMTQMNGRVASFTVLSTTTFSMPIDATGFSAYVSGGKTVNRQVAFSGVESGSGMTILGSNRATYGAVYIDADSYYIDCSENVVGDAALANSTEPFGGADANAGYGDTPNTASRNTLDGIEFEHSDVSNTATAILHGAALAVTVGQRGRVADTIVRNCRVQGYATALTDYDAAGILGPAGTSTALYKGNEGLFNQGPVTQRYTSSGSFAGHPLAVRYKARAWPGGGGGGSGRRGAAGSARSGGTGGGAGMPVEGMWAATEISLPVTMTIGAGGAGGAAVTANDTSGSDGVAGGDTTFGSYLRAIGGQKGFGGGTSAINTLNGGGSGGGLFSGLQQAGWILPVGTSVTATLTGTLSQSIGAPTGFGGGPGGSGGSLSTGNAELGGLQAQWATFADPASTAPTGPAAAGVNGADGANSSLLDFAGNGGGGGGSSASAAGGNGGAGARGSGGGGGGASVNGFNSGAGGAGGGGQVSVTMYF